MVDWQHVDMIWADVKVCRSSLPRVPACNLLPIASVGFREAELRRFSDFWTIVPGTIGLLDLTAQLRIDSSLRDCTSK